MVSQLCNILSKILQAENLADHLQKWRKFLDLSSEQKELDDLINSADQEITNIEENLDLWKEKIRKKKNFKRWRKNQRSRSKVKRKIWKACKDVWKEDIEQKYEIALKNQKPEEKKVSRKIRKKCVALIKLLKCYDRNKAEEYQVKLEQLVNERKQETDICREDEVSVYLSEEHLNDYIRLITDPNYFNKRKQDWEIYNDD